MKTAMEDSLVFTFASLTRDWRNTREDKKKIKRKKKENISFTFKFVEKSQWVERKLKVTYNIFM